MARHMGTRNREEPRCYGLHTEASNALVYRDDRAKVRVVFPTQFRPGLQPAEYLDRVSQRGLVRLLYRMEYSGVQRGPWTQFTEEYDLTYRERLCQAVPRSLSWRQSHFWPLSFTLACSMGLVE